MSSPRPDPAFQDPDGFYAALIAAIDRAGSDQKALQFLTRFSLILASRIGSGGLLRAALALAEEPAQAPKPPA